MRPLLILSLILSIFNLIFSKEEKVQTFNLNLIENVNSAGNRQPCETYYSKEEHIIVDENCKTLDEIKTLMLTRNIEDAKLIMRQHYGSLYTNK
jgi:hypothetical protein